jgi:hypothetical protein
MAGVGNINNMKPPRTKDEAKERGRNGGIASGEARRRKKTMREALEMLLFDTKLNEQTKQMLQAEGIKNADDFNHQMVITRSLIAKAESGDVQAYHAICAMIGEKPSENFNLGGVPTSLHIVCKGDPDYQFPSSESELDLDRPEKQ